MAGKSAVKRVQRPNPHDAAGELKRFIGICSDARKNFSPENFRANVGRAVKEFHDGLDDDSKGLINDVIGIFRKAQQ